MAGYVHRRGGVEHRQAAAFVIGAEAHVIEAVGQEGGVQGAHYAALDAGVALVDLAPLSAALGGDLDAIPGQVWVIDGADKVSGRFHGAARRHARRNHRRLGVHQGQHLDGVVLGGQQALGVTHHHGHRGAPFLGHRGRPGDHAVAVDGHAFRCQGQGVGQTAALGICGRYRVGVGGFGRGTGHRRRGDLGRLVV